MKKETMERRLNAADDICELVLANSKFIVDHLEYMEKGGLKLQLPYQNLKLNLKNLIKNYEDSKKDYEEVKK